MHDDRERIGIVMALLRAVRDFGDAHDRMSGGMKDDMDMNATDMAALRLLIMREDTGQPVSPHEIAKHLRISTASTTKLVDRLVEHGYVARAPHPTDRRSRVVVLTDSARRAFFQRFGPRLAAMREAAGEFTTAELAAAVRVMNAMGLAIGE